LQRKRQSGACGGTALPLPSARSTLAHGKQGPARAALPGEQGTAVFEEGAQNLPFDSHHHGNTQKCY